MMKAEQYIHLQQLFSSALLRSIRLLVIIFILVALANQLEQHSSLKLPLFFSPLVWHA